TDIDQHYGMWGEREQFGPGSDPFEWFILVLQPPDPMRGLRPIGEPISHTVEDGQIEDPDMPVFELCPEKKYGPWRFTGRTKWSDPVSTSSNEKDYYCPAHKFTSKWKLVTETITFLREAEADWYKCTLRKDHTGDHNWSIQKDKAKDWKATKKTKSRQYWEGECGCIIWITK
ncbi:MAG: hypothetical protein R6V75_01400, partial [Bacteroidales bacterium]